MKRSSDMTRRSRQPAPAGHVAVAPRTEAPEALPIVHDVLRTSGRPLDDATRGFMEQRFEHDFSAVRVHHDARAAESADAVHAQAYTVGRNVVFGAGRYEPSTDEGQRLLAHELTHVVQQGGAEYGAGPLPVSRPDDATEREAAAVSSAWRPGSSNAVTHGHSAALLRQPDPKKQPTAAQNYQQALTTLQTKDPEVYRYLSKTTLNSKQTVHSGTAVDASTTPATKIVFDFKLDVKAGTLAAGRDAAFTGGSPVLAQKGPDVTLTADMTMDVSTAATANPAALAEALYHEGIHLLLFIEDLIPPPTASKHATSFAGYRKTATASAKKAPTLADLETYMAKDWATRKVAAHPDAKKAAQEIFDHIVEEKYTFDQERVQFGKGPANAALVLAYIKDGFTDMNVTFDATNKSIQGVASGLTAVLDEIDQATSAKAKPAPQQKPPAPKTPPPKPKP